MKKLFYILFAGMLVSCLQDEVSDDSVRPVGIFLLTSGVLPGEGDADRMEFVWFRFDEAGNRDFLRNNDAYLRIANQDGEAVNLPSSGNVFQTVAGLTPQSTDTLTLQVISNQDNALLAEGACTFPPPINLLSISRDSISLADAVTSSTISWTALDDSRYSYFLRLENLEEQKIPLPFESGRFESRYNGPQIDAELVIQPDDFHYYGRHKLSIFAIDRDFESFYFADASDIRGLLIQGPSNLKGAMGFAAGMSNFSVEIELTD